MGTGGVGDDQDNERLRGRRWSGWHVGQDSASSATGQSLSSPMHAAGWLMFGAVEAAGGAAGGPNPLRRPPAAQERKVVAGPLGGEAALP